MTRVYSVDELIAIPGIRQALALHSQGVDRADEGLLGAAYHADAEVDYGFFKGPASEFVPLLCGAQRQSPLSLHRSAPPWIRMAGMRARSETYVLACASGEEAGGPVQRMIGGRYLDRLSCRDGDWRIDHRHYVMDWNINLPGSSAFSGTSALLANHVPKGGHAEVDPGRALLALGLARPPAQENKRMASHNRDAQIDEALARLAIHDLLMAYARGVDRADVELLASIFLPESTVISGAFNGAGQDFAREITAFVSQNMDHSFHSIANEWVQVAGSRAVGEAYVIAHVTADGTDTITGGRYIDEFECREGVWKISSHTFVADWNMSQPSTFQSDGMYEALDTRGRFGREDPVYRFWNAP
ncbi:MAG: nuclear transport factor 2 family protein [Parahaliea sp.]